MFKLTPSLRDIFKTHGEIPPKKPLPPLFITGCMRSGTTFLVSKITAHPQLLKIGTELNNVWTQIGGAPCIKECPALTEENFNSVYCYNMTMYFKDFIEESKTLKRSLMRANSHLFRGIERINYDWKRIVPVNKSPHIINKIKYVHSLFPESKFIFIVRDIYAQSASMKAFLNKYMLENNLIFVAPEDSSSCWTQYSKQADYNSNNYYPKDFSLIPKMWLRLNLNALKDLCTLPKDKVIVLRYENIVNNQEDELLKVFQKLNLDPSHRLEEIKVATKKITYKNTDTKGDSLKKWKSVLSEEEIKKIENVIEENKKEYNLIYDMLENLEK